MQPNATKSQGGKVARLRFDSDCISHEMNKLQLESQTKQKKL